MYACLFAAATQLITLPPRGNVINLLKKKFVAAARFRKISELVTIHR